MNKRNTILGVLILGIFGVVMWLRLPKHGHKPMAQPEVAPQFGSAAPSAIVQSPADQAKLREALQAKFEKLEASGAVKKFLQLDNF